MHINLPLSKNKDIEIDTESADILTVRSWPGGIKKLSLTEDEFRAMIQFLEENKERILRDMQSKEDTI